MAQQQMGFAAAFLDPRMGRNARLEAIDAAIDWAPLEALAGQVRPGVIGGPPFPRLAMLKALYVQAPHDLSDPQPEARGLIIKDGTLIDATIVQAASRRPAAAPAASAPGRPHSRRPPHQQHYSRTANQTYKGGPGPAPTPSLRRAGLRRNLSRIVASPPPAPAQWRFAWTSSPPRSAAATTPTSQSRIGRSCRPAGHSRKSAASASIATTTSMSSTAANTR